MSTPEPAWAREPAPLRENLVAQESGKEATPAPSEAAPPKRKHAFSKVLCFFRFLTTVTVLLAITVAVVNAYLIYKDYESLGARGVLLRVYGILFSFFIVMAELEWKAFITYFGFLENFMARGMAYAFVGLITWDQTTDDTDYDDVEDITAFMMIGVGVIYLILGMACMRTVKEAELGEVSELGEEDLAKP